MTDKANKIVTRVFGVAIIIIFIIYTTLFVTKFHSTKTDQAIFFENENNDHSTSKINIKCKDSENDPVNANIDFITIHIYVTESLSIDLNKFEGQILDVVADNIPNNDVSLSISVENVRKSDFKNVNDSANHKDENKHPDDSGYISAFLNDNDLNFEDVNENLNN